MSSMKTLVRPGLAAGAIALAVALGGCSGASSDPGAASASAQLPAPVIADLTTIEGTTVTVPVGGAVDLVGDDETFTDWTADIDDPEVVSFTPGKKDASASFNPGLTALSEGDSAVTLTNSSTGQKVEFEVEVTAKG